MAKKRSKQAFDIHRTLPDPQRTAAAADEAPKVKLPKARRALWKRLLVLFLLAALAFGIFIGSWDGINISRASGQIFGTGNLFNLIAGSNAKNQNGRTNILLVGYSVDDPGHPGANLTDSIMLLSMDGKNHSGYMLSIPRDLYVNIPGFGHSKINEAYQDGGMTELVQIVQNNFDTPIDYYALINYSAVRDTVNALGTVTVNIASTDSRGLYDTNISLADGGPLKLSNGPQKLDGQTALNLTRARGDNYGSYGFEQADFDRTQHQRQVLAAIKQKLGWTLVLNPLKNGKIFQAVAKNIKTDIKLGEARSVFAKFNSIPSAQLQSVSLRNIGGKNLLASYATNSGQSALIPAAGIDDYSQIQTAIVQLNQ